MSAEEQGTLSELQPSLLTSAHVTDSCFGPKHFHSMTRRRLAEQADFVLLNSQLDWLIGVLCI